MITSSQSTRISLMLPMRLLKLVRSAAHGREVTQSDIFREALELWTKKQLELEAKELSHVSLDDLPSEDEWNAVQSETLKNL